MSSSSIILITSAKVDVMRSVRLFCHSVVSVSHCDCVHADYCKSSQLISLKLGVMIGPTNRTDCLPFGGDPLLNTNSGSLSTSLTIAE